MPAQDWEWINAPLSSGRKSFTLSCQINGQMVQASLSVAVRAPSASPFYGPTRTPWEEVPAMTEAGLRAAGRPAVTDNTMLFEIEGQLPGYTAEDADRSALIYDPDTRQLIPLQSSSARQPIPGHAVASAIDVSGRYPAVATEAGELWWGHSQCAPTAQSCSTSALGLPLAGADGVSSISTQTAVEFLMVRFYAYRPIIVFDSTNRQLSGEPTNADRNLYFMSDRGETAGIPQLLSRNADGEPFDGPSGRPALTRQALDYLAAVTFETRAGNVLASQGVHNPEHHSQICGFSIGEFQPRYDSLYCVSRNRLTGEFGNGDSSAARAVTTIGNGVIVVFESTASNLVEGDTNQVSDIFVAARDYQHGIKGPVRLSVGSDGQQANQASRTPSISEDGKTVVFESDATNLVPDDRNALTDVYARDLSEGRVERVSTAADGGDANGPSDLAEISSDGRVLFRSSATNLLSAAMPDSPLIYFRQRIRHGGSARPSFSELTLGPVDRGSTCGGGYHAFVLSDGPAQVQRDDWSQLYLRSRDGARSHGAIASLAEGRFNVFSLPPSASTRVVDVVISSVGITPSPTAQIKVRAFEPSQSLFYDGSQTFFDDTVTIEPGAPLHLRGSLRASDISFQVNINSAQHHVVQLQLENADGPMTLPLSIGLAANTGFDPHSKFGGLLGVCLDQPAQIDAALDSASWREELATADLQLSIFDENGQLRYRVPDPGR